MTNIALLILVIVPGLAASRALQHYLEHTTAPPGTPPPRFR
ncbi:MULTISPECIES: hypothetical protein [Rhodococcus]|jgi:hypothetical protein|uniref:Uncharacterized protein n=1 Tax=Rhodococcus koreensis TaxID=99653 RepID=A0A1H4LGJ5_9NOCA|nr:MULTISPECIES: hypothetical protein [Rhodococcus]SEB69804.1 hypothetical protein SAMN04490239_1275 [Rhodococcus koreensis]